MKTAIFDLVHTLFNYDFDKARDEFWEIVKVLDGVGNVSFEKFFEVYDKNFKIYQSTKEANDLNFFKSIFDDLGIKFEVSDLEELSKKHLEIRKTFVKIDESAEKVLTELRKRGYKLGLYSNGVREWSLHDFKITDFEHDKHFDKIVFSQECGFLKPDIKAFALILYEMSTYAKDAFFIGDNYDRDIAGAKNAGMHTIFLNNRRLKEFPDADYEIKKLEEVLKILK
ncbi:MAG: HAD family hydrolase [Candidatus Diapherotrites archaeon]